MAIKPLNSVAGFSVGETPSTVILANGDVTTTNITTTGRSNLNAIGNIYISGGTVGQVIQTDGVGNLSFVSIDSAALNNGNSNVRVFESANVTISSAGNANVLVITGTGINVAGTLNSTGNANVGNLGTSGLITATGNVSGGNLTTTGVVSATGNVSGGNLTTTGVVSATGNVSGGNLTTGGALSVTGNANVGNIGAVTAVFSGNVSSLNANLGNLAIANYIQGTLTTAAQPNITSVGTLSSLSVSGNIAGGNISTTGGLSVTGNANVGNIGAASGVFTGEVSVTGNANVGNLGTIGSIAATGNVSGGNLTTAGQVVATGNVSGGNLTTSGALSVTGNANVGNIGAVTGVFTGNISSLNANLGNLASANFLQGTLTTAAQPNITSVGTLSSLSVSGNVSGGNLTTAGQVVATGNVSGGNVTTAGQVVATGNVSGGNLTTAGVVAATGNVSGGNVTTAGQVVATSNIVTSGNVVTDFISGKTGNVTITAVGANSSINLAGTGSGTINVGNFNISNVGGPTDAHDAATKEYVDNAVSASLSIHEAVLVETPTALNATYTQGGTTPTITDITSGNTLTTSTAHGLSIDDMIVFTNSFNGITGGIAYFVYSVPSSTQITLSASYNGAQLTGLTNGTGLTQASRANSGVGAKLTNAGANVALSIDGVALALTNRVLVYQQANAAHNGIYTVTVVGDGSTAWELTRATDANQYGPNSPTKLGAGDYFFVQSGSEGAGESYVLSTPGVLIIGTTDIQYSQFSDTQVYTAGTGLSLIGTQFSIANTTITSGSYGNGDRVASFTVNSQGQLTAASNVAITANAANLTGTTLNSSIVTSSLTSVGTLGSLTVSGNASAGNIATTGTANVGTLVVTGTSNLGPVGNVTITGGTTGQYLKTDGSGTLTWGTVDTDTLANGTSNVDIPVANGNVLVGVGGTANVAVFTSTGVNIAGTLNAVGNANVGNLGTNGLITATGNVSGGNLTTAGQVVATGNVSGGNLTTAGQVVATGNVSGGNVTTAGVVAATGNVSGGNLTTSGALSVTGNANVGNLGTGGLITATGNITGGNLTTSGALSVTGNANVGNLGTSGTITATGNVSGGNIVASTYVTVGNTSITWANVTTTSITGNQTISSVSVTGVTGVEFLVKAIDSAGAKYSVATVQAVTDGTNVDYATFGTVQLGGYTGSLAVNVVGGFLRLQVTPASSNSTVWTTQYRLI